MISGTLRNEASDVSAQSLTSLLIDGFVHQFGKRETELFENAGAVAIAFSIFTGSFIAAYVSKLLLTALFDIYKMCKGYKTQTTPSLLWKYLCCCCYPRNSNKYRDKHYNGSSSSSSRNASKEAKRSERSYHKRKSKDPYNTIISSSGKISTISLNNLVSPNEDIEIGEVTSKKIILVKRKQNMRERERQPFHNIIHLIILLIGILIIMGGVIWALHVMNTPFSALASYGIIGYVVGQAAGPIFGNVICGIIIMSTDLIEIGEFIEIPGGRGKGYVQNVSSLWTVLDDPSDNHINDKEIYISNRDIVMIGVYRYPRHERFTEYLEHNW